MAKYVFDFERFQKTHGKLCPCLVASKDTAQMENMCPCKEFVDTGKCRCMLFLPVDED
ncbi:MAG: ferredoxin-thioredoxin reductase catalytic domain-containing protein [Nanoarchaeota archaeon]